MQGIYTNTEQIDSRIRQDILKEKRAEYGEEIISTLSIQLSWSHFVEIIPLKDDLQRDFYAEMCRIERWSVRTLRKKLMECFTSAQPYQRSLRNW